MKILTKEDVQFFLEKLKIEKATKEDCLYTLELMAMALPSKEEVKQCVVIKTSLENTSF